MKKILIVRGATSADELKMFGLPMAQRFAESDEVIGISRDGKATTIKTKELSEISFVNGEAEIGEFAQLMDQVRHAYIQGHPDHPHLAHAFVGLWLFFWMGDSDGISPTAIELAGQSDMTGLRESARRFIASDFGAIIHRPSSMGTSGDFDPAAT